MILKALIKESNEKKYKSNNSSRTYWFTSSTFFCNPAVTFARSLTDTFVGIAPQNILGFVIPQIIALILILKIIKK